MTLVPADMLGQIREMPLITHMSNLDLEMDKILQDKQLPMEQKFRQYQTALYRYQVSQHERDKPKIKEQLPVVESKRFPKEQLLADVPRQKQRNARLLVEFIENIPELSLTDKNEIRINNETIPNSNIIDLMADLTRDRREGPPPRGFQEFSALLHEHNVPLEAIGNRKRRETMTPQMSETNTPVRRHRRQESLDDETPIIERKSSRIAKLGPRQNYASIERGQRWDRL